MTTPVDFTPPSLDFGGVFPGSGPDISVDPNIATVAPWTISFNGGILIANAPADANVTASITNGTSTFEVRDVIVLEYRMEDIDPIELPPGFKGHPKQKVLEPIAQSDGIVPLAVKKGQTVLVRVYYMTPTIESTFTGTLAIQGDTWDTVQVPLSLFPVQVITTTSDTLNIAQGHQANLPLVVTSVMGPETDVSYVMTGTQFETGLTLLPNGFHLNQKETKSFSLVFKADSNAPLGSNYIALYQRAFQQRGLFIKANIVHPQIIVNPAQPNNIRSLKRNVAINIPISISLSDGPETDVNFSHGALPTGVSMQPGSFSIQADTTVNLDLFLGNETPDQFQFSINWSAYKGEQTGVMDFGVTIVPELMHLYDGVTTQDWAPIGGWVDIVLNNKGEFTFKGHMRDSGAINIDYALGILVITPSGIGYGWMHKGHVDGTITLFGRNRDDDWTETGANQQIAGNWDQVTKARLFWSLVAQDTLSKGIQGLLEDLAKEAVKKGAVALVELILA